jgi:hypothetical protein
MDFFFIWLETTWLSLWVRESVSVFAFPSVLSMHTIGMGFVAGVNGLIGLRILGVARSVPLLELRRFLPVMWAGFWLNAVSGVVLLIGYPTKALTNPLFYLKLVLVALALVALRSIRNLVFANPKLDFGAIPAKGRYLAAASLFCWSGAIVAGRLLAYTYSKLTTV